MTEDERRWLEQEIKRFNSLPALLEAMARSESNDFRTLRQEVEDGLHHPSGEDLYNYVLGWLDQEHSLRVLDHVVLCGRCLEEVMKIQQIEEALTKDALERADKLPWIERVKDFISSLSFPLFLVPSLDTARTSTSDEEKQANRVGEDRFLRMEAPADGYVTIFHCCEETGEVDLVFPREPGDNPQVTAGQEIAPIKGSLEGPPGKHFFKAFWTKDMLWAPQEFDLEDEEERQRAIHEFVEALENLDQSDWKASIWGYEVAGE